MISKSRSDRIESVTKVTQTDRRQTEQTGTYAHGFVGPLYTKAPEGAINHLAFKSFSDPLK